MLNELEQKIRKAITELQTFESEYKNEPIQLNHVLEYVKEKGSLIDLRIVVGDWNLKSNLLSEQSIKLITFVNEL